MDRVIHEPAAEPLALAEVKAHLNYEDSDDDALIAAYLGAARRWAETYTRRSLVRQTRRYRLDRFGGRAIELPNSPLRAVRRITYVDSTGAVQEWASSSYRVDAHSDVPRIEPAWGESWPTTRDVVNAVTVEYSAGWAAPFTVDPDTDTLASAGHDLADNDLVPVDNSGGDLPSSLDADASYYVVNATADTFQLSESEGGSPVDLTDAGTGIHYAGLVPGGIRAAVLLLVAHLYENREAVNVGNIVNEMPFGVRALLDPESVRSF